MLDKTAVSVSSRIEPNSAVHKSKDSLFTVLNSFVMPKGNPMKVIKTTAWTEMSIKIALSSCSLIFMKLFHGCKTLEIYKR